MIQVRKVIEHVYEKVLRQGVENGHQSGESGDHEKEAQDISKLAAEKVELLCNDQVQIILKQISVFEILIYIFYMFFLYTNIYFYMKSRVLIRLWVMKPTLL